MQSIYEVTKGEKMYSRLTHSWLKHWNFILLDMICLEVSFLLAFIIRHGMINSWTLSLYRSEAVILFICQLLAVFFGDSFSGIMKRGYYIEFSNTVKHVMFVMAFALAVLFATKETGTYSRIVFGITGILYVVISYGARLVLKRIVCKNVAKSSQHSMVIVTTKELSKEVIENLKKENFEQYKIQGICLMNAKRNETKVKGYPVIEDEEKVIDFACREWVDEVLIYLPSDVEMPQEMMDTLTMMGVAIHVPVVGRNFKGSKQFVETIGGYTVLTTSMNIVASKQMFYKRAMDIVGGIVGCLITLVLIVIVGPIIFIKSPGPIFFTQTRIGKNGRKFKIHKFRSMYMDAEERKKEYMAQNKMDGLMFKMNNDPRIIGSEKIGKDGKPKGIGNFIRSTSIDEFPQFWNVLKGEMSLVGTRPPTLDEWERYEPHHRARMAIKPGITGMWQVSGRSDITDFEEVVRLDTEYIEKWNLGLDIKILLMTVVRVLKNDGAV